MMEKTYQDKPVVAAKNRAVWRQWLEKHHAEAQAAWLVIHHKSSGTPSVYYDEAVEEALCYGWIDSKPNKRDATSYYLFFSRRKPRSVWSKLNRERAERLIREKKMRPAGKRMVDLAKASGTWDSLKEIEALTIPADLKALFVRYKVAARNFHAFPISTRQQILFWIRSARTLDTRIKRIRETVELAKENKRANQYVRKK